MWPHMSRPAQRARYASALAHLQKSPWSIELLHGASAHYCTRDVFCIVHPQQLHLLTGPVPDAPRAMMRLRPAPPGHADLPRVKMARPSSRCGPMDQSTTIRGSGKPSDALPTLTMAEVDPHCGESVLASLCTPEMVGVAEKHQ